MQPTKGVNERLGSHVITNVIKSTFCLSSTVGRTHDLISTSRKIFKYNLSSFHIHSAGTKAKDDLLVMFNNMQIVCDVSLDEFD